MVLNAELTRVLQVSANLSGVLGVAVDQALRSAPDDLLDVRLVRRLKRALGGHPGPQLPLVLRRQVGGRTTELQLLVYPSDDRLVLEFEPLPPARAARPLAAVNQWLAALSEGESRRGLLEVLAAGVRDTTGYERAMVYQFDVDWHGEVVAESLAPGLASFLGHRFPASDIPPQVRDLYGVNPVRSIPDATAAPVPLAPPADPLGRGPLDLSPGNLRAASPVHLRYLATMGVRASLSLAIHRAGELWGLVACHGVKARGLSPRRRDAALALVRMATQRLFLLEARDNSRYLQRVLDSRELISEYRGKLLSPAELVRSHGQAWLDLFAARGLALVIRRDIAAQGERPDDAVLLRLVNRLTAGHHQPGPWVTDNLGASMLGDVKGLEDFPGLMALRLPVDSPPGWMLWFRRERVVTHRWAGRPVDVPEIRDGRPVLGPRHSFDTWVEEVHGLSHPWLPIERQAALDLAEDLAVAISAQRIAELNKQLQQANRELALLAHTDALTQSWNRYRMELALDEELSASDRYDRPCSVLLFDVDHFKQFNDRHGHEAGDRVLSGLAASVKASLRPTDHLGRWGGEEFIVLAANTELEGARELGERLRRDIAGVDFGALGAVTISVGVAQRAAGESRKSLVARADEAMYRAKQRGRNRVEVNSAEH